MYKCDRCEKTFDNRQSYAGHRSNCGKKSNLVSDKLFPCRFCGEKYKSRALGGHTTWCKKNPKVAEQKKKLSEKGKKRICTAETRDKISKSRIKYLTENPDKVPYLINHSSNKSWPEEVFENALKSSGITGWVTRYQNGIYQYDFAFPKLKIDVEVDGGTHKQEKVIKIDKRRDEWSKSQGWKIIRFTAQRVKKDVIGCVNELKEYMGR